MPTRCCMSLKNTFAVAQRQAIPTPRIRCIEIAGISQYARDKSAAPVTARNKSNITKVSRKFTPLASAVETGSITLGKKTFFTRLELPAMEYSESLRHPAVNCHITIPATRNCR